MSFFSTTVYLALGVIMFSAGISFVVGLDIFPSGFSADTITGLDAGMDIVWTEIVGFGTVFTLVICIILRSVVPLGIHLFGLVYWTSWVRACAILSFGGFIPLEFILLFTIAIGFVFVAAIISMLTGSG